MTTTELRSRIMRAVKSKNTKPEILVRSLAHNLGYRFRLHRSDLPGHPDIAFPKKKKVVFVHGCFWHGHSCARGARRPKTNAAYWQQKISKNKARDAVHRLRLKRLGWASLVLWECELRDPSRIERRLTSFLEKSNL